jgi:hypothetical protein
MTQHASEKPRHHNPKKVVRLKNKKHELKEKKEKID